MQNKCTFNSSCFPSPSIFSSYQTPVALLCRNSHKMASKKVAVLSQDAPAPSPLMSQAIICNGMVYCSGSLGIDGETGKFVEGDTSDRTVS